MTGGLEIEGGHLVVKYGNRRVATMEGTLLQFLTDQETFTANLNFPNPSQHQGYSWSYNNTRAPEDRFRIVTTAQSYVLAPKDEWSTKIVLGPIEPGADLFVGRASLSRIAAPSTTWFGQSLVPLVPQNVEMQLTGSILVETALGISREVSVYIEGGNLIAHLEQSVGPNAGNFGNFGHIPIAVPPNSTNDAVRVGWQNHGPAGLPVWWSDSAPYRSVNAFEAKGFFGVGDLNTAINNANRTNIGGDLAASFPGVQNYASTYAITVRGRFGRRS